MRVVTSNIKSNPEMPQPDVESDIAAIRDQLRAHVYLGQEIDPARYKHAWHGGFTESQHTSYALTVEVPQACRLEGWAFLGEETRMAHGGLSKTSPARYLTVTKWRRKDGLLVAFMGVHYVSGAWNKRSKLNKSWRKTKWWVNWRKQRAWIVKLNKDGYTVVSGGDYNRTTVKPFTKRQVKAAQHGIDRIEVNPTPGVQVKLGTQRTLGPHPLDGMNTDHPAVMARLRLQRADKNRAPA